MGFEDFGSFEKKRISRRGGTNSSEAVYTAEGYTLRRMCGVGFRGEAVEDRGRVRQRKDLSAKERLQNPFAMHNTEDQNIAVVHAVQDYVFADSKVAGIRTNIVVAGPPQIGEPAQNEKRSVMESTNRPATSILPLA